MGFTPVNKFSFSGVNARLDVSLIDEQTNLVQEWGDLSGDIEDRDNASMSVLHKSKRSLE